jgi:hypothetical protein
VPAIIYFSGSISGGRQDLALYQRIVRALEADGHSVLAGAVANEDVGDGGESLAPQAIFERDLRWLDDAGVVVAEVSVPSNGVGYEIAYARYERRIPVIALWRPAYTKRCSAMLSGDPGIELIQYQTEVDLLPRLLESLRHLGRYVGRLP